MLSADGGGGMSDRKDSHGDTEARRRLISQPVDSLAPIFIGNDRAGFAAAAAQP